MLFTSWEEGLKPSIQGGPNRTHAPSESHSSSSVDPTWSPSQAGDICLKKTFYVTEDGVTWIPKACCFITKVKDKSLISVFALTKSCGRIWDDLLSQVMLSGLYIWTLIDLLSLIMVTLSAFICGLWGVWILSSTTHAFLETSRTSQGHLETLHSIKAIPSIYHPVWCLLLPCPSLLAPCYCPLPALLPHLLLFSAIKSQGEVWAPWLALLIFTLSLSLGQLPPTIKHRWPVLLKVLQGHNVIGSWLHLNGPQQTLWSIFYSSWACA